jgi:hypothetical protein
MSHGSPVPPQLNGQDDLAVSTLGRDAPRFRDNNPHVVDLIDKNPEHGILVPLEIAPVMPRDLEVRADPVEWHCTHGKTYWSFASSSVV